MKRHELIEMVNQELDELRRMADRKADKKTVEPYLLKPKKKVPKTVKFQLDKNRLQDLYNNTYSYEFLNYNFGINLKDDFSNMFSIFNRVAKAKLDNMVLSDYASQHYVDTLFQQASTNFSTQLTTHTELYFAQIDNRLRTFQKKFTIFRANVDFCLTQLEDRIFYCKTQITKMKNRHQLETKKTTSQMGKKKDLTVMTPTTSLQQDAKNVYRESNKLIKTAFLLKNSTTSNDNIISRPSIILNSPTNFTTPK